MADPSNATGRLLSAAASDNATLVKAGNIFLSRATGYNAAAAARYLKLYDKATAPASTDVPRKTLYLPPTSAFSLDMNDFFVLGLGYRITVGSADNDTAALTAGDILGLNLDYR